MAKLSAWAWIGNAAAALGNVWGAVSQRARAVGCSRQTVYEHGRRVTETVEESQLPGRSRAELAAEVARLRDENRQLWEWLDEAIAFPRERRERFAATAAALGLSVSQIRDLLQIVLARRCPGRSPTRR